MGKFIINNYVLEKYIFEGDIFKEDISEIIIPNNVKIIRSNAFSDCRWTHVKKLYIPAGVKLIPLGIFGRLNNLDEIEVSEENQKYSSFNGALFDKEKTVLMRIPGNKSGEYILPDTVQSIRKKAFYYCSELEKLNIPKPLSNIDNRTFTGCHSLKRIDLFGDIFQLQFDRPGSYDAGIAVKAIMEHDFTKKIDLKNKHIIMAACYLAYQDKEAEEYLKKYISKVMQTLIDIEDSKNMIKILDCGKFITKRNIEKLIEYASQKEKTEIYTILVNYKESHYGFRDLESMLKL